MSGGLFISAHMSRVTVCVGDEMHDMLMLSIVGSRSSLEMLTHQKFIRMMLF